MKVLMAVLGIIAGTTLSIVSILANNGLSFAGLGTGSVIAGMSIGAWWSVFRHEEGK